MTTNIPTDRYTLDRLAQEALNRLAGWGFFDFQRAKFRSEIYHKFSKVIHEKFVIPATSITPIMSRMFFGITSANRPNVIVGIGTYVGYGLAWLAGPTLYSKPIYKARHIFGIDPDAYAISVAKINFSSLACMDKVTFLCEDAQQVVDKLPEPFDLVYLDADDSIIRKRIYCRLLEKIYPHLRQGGLILAHDVCYPKFTNDLLLYLKTVKDRERFTASATLQIDEYGLEVTMK